MILAAALVTGGFVYSVSRAGEPPAAAEPVAPPPPPPPSALEEPIPAPVAALPGGGTSMPSSPPRPPRAVAANPVAPDPRDDARRRAAERRRSPVVIMVAGEAGDPARPATGAADPASRADPLQPGGATARARLLTNQGALIVQGTLVPGVLETAINSDLPGLLRAVVAADITSFDGRRVLIPRGSRLIGQYRSGLAIGQTRAFVLWTRLITPDGVSLELASPGTDALGRAGVAGSVDRHFLERFGAALLLSVVGSGVQAAASAGGGDDITVNAAGDAARVAELALQSSAAIPPTIKVRQGTPIRVLVARDLDFSAAPGAASGG